MCLYGQINDFTVAFFAIADPTKYFGCELGAQTQFDHKNDRFIVNGSHDASKLQSLLDGFIKRFVLCQECSNPETNLVSGITYFLLKHLFWMLKRTALLSSHNICFG